jgi:hypothetical protein
MMLGKYRETSAMMLVASEPVTELNSGDLWPVDRDTAVTDCLAPV